MGVEPWPLTDPSTAHKQMIGGAGPGPMHAASAVLHALGGSVEGTVATSVANAAALATSWSGQGNLASSVSAAAMAGADSHYALLSMLKGQLLNTAGELHTTTASTMVTFVQADANRGEWGIDNAINPWVLGMLTPRLIDLDTEYFGFMWPNNASAGLRYGAGLDALGAAMSGLSALPSIAGGSVAAPAMAAADVASNAGMSMMSAVMSVTEQAATSAISPATSGATQAGSLVGQSPLSAPNTSSSTSGISPMAAVQSQTPVSPALAQSQPPAMGMFAPPAAAALTPSAPSPVMPSSPPVQTMAPSAAPGVTSFAKPAEPFNPPPPPSGGKAVGLKPGMLNASALRGPVGTAPASTGLLTKPLTTASSLATQPLAYVTPDVPRPVSSTPPPHPLLSDPGSIQTLNPPPAPPPQTSPPAPPPANPQAPPQSAPPAPSDGPEPGPGTGGPDPGIFQMLGNGLGGAPQAPQLPMPLDPAATPQQIAQMNEQEARAELDKFNDDQALWNTECKGTLPLPAYNACMTRLSGLNARRAALIARFGQLGIPVDLLPPGVTAPHASGPAQAPSPPPPTPPEAPASQQPNAPTGPSLQQQATQIGRDVGQNVPKGARLDTLIDRLNQLHISDQQQAAEAAEAAAKATWGETAGIVDGPNGAKLVLPANPLFGEAIMVAPDGTLSAFRGDLFPFLPK
jgi:hypothetical protein